MVHRFSSKASSSWLRILACVLSLSLLLCCLGACEDPRSKRDKRVIHQEAREREKRATNDPILDIKAEALHERLIMQGPLPGRALASKAKMMMELAYSPLLGYEISQEMPEEIARYLGPARPRRPRGSIRYFFQSQAPLFDQGRKLVQNSLQAVEQRVFLQCDPQQQQLGGMTMVGDQLLISDRKARCLYLYDLDGRQTACIGRACDGDGQVLELDQIKDAIGKPPILIIPTRLAYHPPSGQIYVLDEGSDRIVVLDREGRLLARHRLPPAPPDMAVFGRDIAVTDAGELYLSIKNNSFPSAGLFHLRENGAFFPLGYFSGGLVLHQGALYAIQEMEPIEVFWSKKDASYQMNSSSKGADDPYLYEIKDGKAYITDALPPFSQAAEAISFGDGIFYFNKHASKLQMITLDEGRITSTGSLEGLMIFSHTYEPNYQMAVYKDRLFILDHLQGVIHLLTWDGMA